MTIKSAKVLLRTILKWHFDTIILNRLKIRGGYSCYFISDTTTYLLLNYTYVYNA